MNLALFDFDGTITTREMLPDFIRMAVSPRRLALGKVLLAPLIIGYRPSWRHGVYGRAYLIPSDLRLQGKSLVSCTMALTTGRKTSGPHISVFLF